MGLDAICSRHYHRQCNRYGDWHFILTELLKYSAPELYRDDATLHQRYVSHTINHVVTNAMSIIRVNFDPVRSLVSLLGSSTMRKDLYETFNMELRFKSELPGLDFELMWSSKFRILEQTYSARRLLTTTMQRLPDLQNTVITDRRWEPVNTLSIPAKTSGHNRTSIRHIVPHTKSNDKAIQQTSGKVYNSCRW